LRAFTAHHGCPVNGSSLGSYLYGLKTQTSTLTGAISEADRDNYQTKIVNRRNTYMHEAGAFPSERDVRTLLADMEACLSQVLALE
jgi:hypothetical protein